ncbi:MAG: Fic family protein [Flavobacteriales bacterium]
MSKPPYEITPRVLELVVAVSEKLGQINAHFLDKPSPQLRKINRIKTIYSSLSIEGNTLSEAQITDIIDNKRVVGPKKDITEVLNAIKAYDEIGDLKVKSKKSFLKAHHILMQNLIEDNGRYRKSGVGIMAGNKIAHMAPPAKNVPYLMEELFEYLKNSKEITLIKSCVFHYEMEFIHPFIDGNGRMGRLWQTLILMQEYPVFEFIPLENVILNSQKKYYQALAKSDKLASSTPFVEYMLEVIDNALTGMLNLNQQIRTSEDRVSYFIKLGIKSFSRKDYMNVFKNISTATASRDLKNGVENGFFSKEGDKKNTTYRIKN